jgi:hypothetical protein
MCVLIELDRIDAEMDKVLAGKEKAKVPVPEVIVAEEPANKEGGTGIEEEPETYDDINDIIIHIPADEQNLQEKDPIK